VRPCRGFIPGARERWELAQGGELSRGRGSGGEGEALVVMGMLWSCCGTVVVHTGMIPSLCESEGGEGAMAPGAYDVLRAADSGGWSRAITPLCPF